MHKCEHRIFPQGNLSRLSLSLGCPWTFPPPFCALFSILVQEPCRNSLFLCAGYAFSRQQRFHQLFHGSWTPSILAAFRVFFLRSTLPVEAGLGFEPMIFWTRVRYRSSWCRRGLSSMLARRRLAEIFSFSRASSTQMTLSLIFGSRPSVAFEFEG